MGDPTVELLEGYSQALYATWLWYRPFRLLFDAGEGVALRLQNGVFGVRHLFCSHGHLDHISGLPTLFNIRGNGMGDNAQPLTIAHPHGDVFLGWMRDYLERYLRVAELEVDWLALDPGDRVTIDPTRTVEAFARVHVKGQPALGYRVLEQRKRLRPELAGRPESALRELARREGAEAVNEPYEHPLLVYGGDGLAPSPEELAGADVACLEATFLSAEDRGRPTHATVDEAVAAAAAAKVRTLVLAHLSGRYRLREVRQTATAAAARHGFQGTLLVLWRERLVLLTE